MWTRKKPFIEFFIDDTLNSIAIQTCRPRKILYNLQSHIESEDRGRGEEFN